ncbi:hypothetical protein L2E82_30870 [Cichorium intybus]|uniref:Uncharacterized protein n=1 Tax=Cichorium intybus TaxID=13427 RepID=A0ACB9D212_CICIN|nr:hypothetical protein L2E82_30870 [Cichorium intybus]
MQYKSALSILKLGLRFLNPDPNITHSPSRLSSSTSSSCDLGFLYNLRYCDIDFSLELYCFNGRQRQKVTEEAKQKGAK